MDVMLQNHNAKFVCEVPDGLRELCADISREVIRSQPRDIHCFIADYLDALLITRENAKVAIKVIENVVMESEQIVEILIGTGLDLKAIAAAIPRLQKAFRAYLDAVNAPKKECGCDDDDSEIDDDNELSISRILREIGATFREAHCAAIKIQALFRGHYERLSLAEKRGEIVWQKAAVNTMEILRKTGISEAEASYAATIIQAVYRGYYTRKNLKHRKMMLEQEGYEEVEPFDVTAWLEMMYENTGLTREGADSAAKIIQTAWRRYYRSKQPTLQLGRLGKSRSKSSRVTEATKLEVEADNKTGLVSAVTSASTAYTRKLDDVNASILVDGSQSMTIETKDLDAGEPEEKVSMAKAASDVEDEANGQEEESEKVKEEEKEAGDEEVLESPSAEAAKSASIKQELDQSSSSEDDELKETEVDKGDVDDAPNETENETETNKE